METLDPQVGLCFHRSGEAQPVKSSEKWMVAAVLGALGIVLLCLVCIVGVVLFPLRWWSQGGAAGVAKEYLAKNPVVVGKLGAVKEFGRFPSGSESIVNGVGTAHFIISIKGERGDGSAAVDLAKKSGETWKVVSGTLTVMGETFPLDGQAPAIAQPTAPELQDQSPADADNEPRDI